MMRLKIRIHTILLVSVLPEMVNGVDDTEDVYVTDGSLANELDRIYHYREFATK